jgi:hypothetical protein
MFLRVATLIAAASATAAIGSAAAHADTADQQFLNTVHSHGVGGQDDTLIAYAYEFCSPTIFYPSGYALAGQGVQLGQFNVIQTAAAPAYCPNKVVTGLS